MKRKYPDASVLTLITQSEDDHENLIFIYLKPVPDFYSRSGIFWYNGVGQDGKGKNIWEKLSIKQWLACGKDHDMINLFDEILSTSQLTIGEKKINFPIPSYELLSYRDNPLKNRSETTYDSLVTKHVPFIPQEFCQKENLEVLSGYKTNPPEITPFFPLGFFERDFIYKKLKQNIWGIKEYRTAYLTFHGVRETSKKGEGSKELIGFYQQNFDPNFEYTVIANNENSIEIGKTTIDRSNGTFKLNLSEPTKEGRVEVQANGMEKTIEYTLIQDIEFNVCVDKPSYIDIYGRSYPITEDIKNRLAMPPNFTWQQGVYLDKKIASQNLSDLFKKLFDYLGPRMVVSDPYFIGDVKVDDTTKQFLPSHCQQAFINALVRSAVENGIEQLTILGHWARARKQIEKDQTQEGNKVDQFFENYERWLKGVISNNKLQEYFPPSSILFRNAKEDFHNRYWFSQKNEGGFDILDKCVIITNSIGNIIEVDAVNVTDDEYLTGQIIRNRFRLLHNAEPRLEI